MHIHVLCYTNKVHYKNHISYTVGADAMLHVELNEQLQGIHKYTCFLFQLFTAWIYFCIGIDIKKTKPHTHTRV